MSGGIAMTESKTMTHAGQPTRHFGHVANYVARAAGRPSAFALATFIILIWALTGPIFNYSDTWQLVINTGTTVVTFLMVFLIQNSQNRDNAAIQAKLDEIVRAGRGQNVFVGIEHLTDAEIEDLTKKCEDRAKTALLRHAKLTPTAPHPKS
jgi:low affinity Fe/Cu permease